MLDFIPRCRIELKHTLENALDDVESWTGLENVLQAVIAPLHKPLRSITMQDIFREPR